MQSVVEFSGQQVTIDHPSSLEGIIRLLFKGHLVSAGISETKIQISERKCDLFHLKTANGQTNKSIIAEELPKKLMDAVIEALTSNISDAVCLHAGMLGWKGKSVLLVGGPKSGKSILAAWMAINNHDYRTDELIAIGVADLVPINFACPIILNKPNYLLLNAACGGSNVNLKTREIGEHVFLSPTSSTLSTRPAPIGAIIFPELSQSRKLVFRSVSSGDAIMKMFANSLNGNRLPDGGLRVLSDLVRRAPSAIVKFQDPAQLADGFEDLITEMMNGEFDPQQWHRLHNNFASEDLSPTAEDPAQLQRKKSRPINPPTARGKPVRLTIGMATYDDYDGVYFTIQSLRLNNMQRLTQIEFLVIDNNPGGQFGDALKKLESFIPNYRYVPYVSQSGTAVRDMVFAEAAGEFVMCVDCHVLLETGAIEKLFEYFESNPTTNDLLQGPMINENLKEVALQFDPVWSNGMFGTWALKDIGENLGDEAFDIPSQGLGLFASRRIAWPGFNLKFRGFGGEEGYIHEKFRQRGDRALCLPFLRWLHRFARPRGVPYRINWEDRIRNYIIGFRELGLDEEPIADHFSEVLGRANYEPIAEGIEKELESAFNYFDGIRWINLDSRPDRQRTMQYRFGKIGIEKIANRFPAIETPDNHHVGCALSHRAIIEDAKRRNLRHILIIEDDAIFHHECVQRLGEMVEELDTIDWDLFYLGGYIWGKEGEFVSGNSNLRHANILTTTHAIAVNRNMFDLLLDELPASAEEMEGWIEANLAIDQYYASLNVRKYVAEPMLAVQIEHFGQPKPMVRHDYDMS